MGFPAGKGHTTMGAYYFLFSHYFKTPFQPLSLLNSIERERGNNP
jgi:hypothetical protein